MGEVKKSMTIFVKKAPLEGVGKEIGKHVCSEAVCKTDLLMVDMVCDEETLDANVSGVFVLDK